MPETIRLPQRSNRTLLIGQTGTGKTVAGLWHLSNQDLEHPWVILNFKNDEHIDSIPYARDIDFDFVPGKRDKGLFILRPGPADMKRPAPREPSPMESYCWEIWKRGNCGIFCDETYMLGENDAFNTCLTQGRSLKIPMIMCTQRPAWISRFCFSEASFIQCFDLIDQDDIRRVEGFMPLIWDEEKPLGEHQSWYYDVGKRKLVRLNPTPPMKKVLPVFEKKLERKYILI